MIKYSKIITILFFMGLLISPNIFAQYNQEQARNKLSEELAKTDRVIEQARMVIGQSNTAYDSEYLRIATQQANYLLDKAIKFQKHARAFQNDATLAGLLTGGKITMEARELAWKAIAVKRRAEGKVEENENTALRQLEKTDNLIDRIKEHAPTDVNNRLKTVFKSALESQKRAWELYRERALRAALKLSRRTEKSLIKLGERVRSGNMENRRLQNQIMQTEQKMEQMRSEIQECNSEEARRLIQQAEQSLKECARLLGDEKLKRAGNKLKNTLRLLQKVNRLCTDSESLMAMIARLKTELERASDPINQSGRTAAIRLLESARRHIQDADRFCNSDDTEACAASIKAAQMNLRKALKLTGN